MITLVILSDDTETPPLSGILGFRNHFGTMQESFNYAFNAACLPACLPEKIQWDTARPLTYPLEGIPAAVLPTA